MHISKKKKFKNFWQICKQDLENEIEQNHKQAEQLIELKHKKKEYFKLYQSQQSINHEMSKLYEQQESKMSELRKDKTGWMPVHEFNTMKTQLKHAQNECKKHLEMELALRNSHSRKSEFLTKTIQSEEDAQKEAEEARKDAERYHQHAMHLARDLKET